MTMMFDNKVCYKKGLMRFYASCMRTFLLYNKLTWKTRNHTEYYVLVKIKSIAYLEVPCQIINVCLLLWVGGTIHFIQVSTEYLKPRIKLMKGKALMKNSLHGKKSSLGFIDAMNQWLWKMPHHWSHVGHERKSIFKCK